MHTPRIIQTPSQKWGPWLLCAFFNIACLWKLDALMASMLFSIVFIGLMKSLDVYWKNQLSKWAHNQGFELLEIQFLRNAGFNEDQLIRVRVKDQGESRVATLRFAAGWLWFHGTVNVEWEPETKTSFPPKRHQF